MKTKVYNFKRETVGEIEVPESTFGAKWNPVLVRQVLEAQLANLRHPWAHAKGRGEVRGGGRKPWRQKGTGRARHGSIRSPIWIGGGKSHGPSNERDYSKKVNKKMRRGALASILSRKLKDGDVSIMENLGLKEPKTKILALELMKFLGAKRAPKKFDILLVPGPENKMINRAARNLPKAKSLSPDSLNVYDLMNYKHILVDQSAVSIIAK